MVLIIEIAIGICFGVGLVSWWRRRSERKWGELAKRSFANQLTPTDIKTIERHYRER